MCKRLLVLLIFVLVSAMMRLEAQQLNYQAIARSANGVALTFRDVGIRLSIRDGSQTGSIVYSETRNVRTNQFGLFTVVIGSPGASNVLGSMASINWISGNKYLQVEIDPEGGNNYFQAGTSQLQAVPYALFANAAYPVGPAGGDLLGSNYPNPIIAPLAVTTGKIANQAITTPKIADLNVTTAKLADQAITNPKIQDNTIANIKLVNSRVTLNGLVLNLGDAQDFAIGTTGTDVNILSAGKTHTFNFPDASIANRGLITPNAQTIGGNKTFNNNITAASFIKAGGIAAQFLKADGSVDNNTYLTANQPIIVTATGDATGVSTSSGTAPVLPLTLATVNSAVGTFGNNITVPSITVNNKGLVTDVIANPIPTATATTNGLLTVGDWNTFNNKQNAIPLGISTQYFKGDLTLGNFTTDVRNQLSAGTNITYANGNIGLTNNSVTINSLPLALGGSQSFATGNTGTDFTISSAGTVHSFNIPTASATNRGLLSQGDFSNFNAAFASRITGVTTTGSSGPATLSGNVLNIPNYTLAGLGGISSSTSLNGLALSSNQTFASGNTGSDFNIVSSGTTHTFNIPNASTSTRGLLSSADWNTFNSKQSVINGTGYGKWNGSTISFNSQIPLGTDVSGTLLAANFGALTGDVTNIAGSYTTTIANNAITSDKIADANVTNNKLANKSITLNGLAVDLGASQTFSSGSIGNDFNIASSGSTHTFHLPSSSASARGLLTSTDWSNFNSKQNSISGTGYGKWNGSLFSFNSQIPLGTDVSGILLAGNFGQLTGDVTNAPGSYTTTIANDAITTVKIADANVTNNKLANKSITLNGLVVDLGSSQTFATGSTGSDFNIASLGSTHTFHLPSSSATTRGLLTSTDWSTFNGKQNVISGTGYGNWNGSNISFNSQIPLGSDVSGTLLAANFGALTGDVTNIAGSYTTTIANNAITTAKILDGNVTNNKLANKSITLNGLVVDLGSSQSFASGSTGNDFNIASIGSTHTFHLPSSSATARGLLTSTDWSTFNGKQNAISGTGYGNWNGSTISFNSQIPLGSDVSGTLLAANFGALTGDVTNIAGSYTTTIANNAITSAKIADANVTNAKLANKSITLNGLAVDLGSSQTFASGSTGTDFDIVSLGSTHTFNFPSSSSTARGLLTSTDWINFNGKQNAISGTGYGKWSGSSISFNNQIPLGTDVSGTLLAANFGALTGDVTNIAGSYTTTIANNAITSAKIADGAVTNAKLSSNGSFTLGSTSISLGGTTTTVADLTLTTPTINLPAIYYTNTPTGLTLTGSLQGSHNLTSDINIVTSAAASSAVTLPVAQAGRQVIIVNRGANPINVFPASGAQINSLVTNAAFSNIPANSYAEFYATSTTQWYSANSIATSTSSWNILGNTGINDNINFIGTTDDKILKFRVSDEFSGQIHYDPAVANTSFGYETNNSGILTSAFGYRALKANNSTGERNSAFGTVALSSNTSGDDNTAVGSGALATNNAGNNNTAVGQASLALNITGHSNTAIGQAAMYSNTNGLYNTAMGKDALFSNLLGEDNTAIGHSAARLSTGTGNTSVGRSSLLNLTTGSYNVILGHEAGTKIGLAGTVDLTNISNSIIIGKSARPLANAGSNEIVIGDNAVGNGNNSVQLGNSLIERVNTTGAITTTRSLTANKVVGNSGTPTISGSTTYAGTSPTITINGNDMAGIITFTVGTAPSPALAGGSTLFELNFNSSYLSNPVVLINAVRTNGVNLGLINDIFVIPSSTLTNKFTLTLREGITLTAGNIIEIAYHVIGR